MPTASKLVGTTSTDSNQTTKSQAVNLNEIKISPKPIVKVNSNLSKIAESDSEKDSEETEEESKVQESQHYVDEPYTELGRYLGTGPVRIGKKLKLHEDMYSLMFVAFLKTEYKEACEREVLEEVPVSQVMTPLPPAVTAQKKETLSELLESVSRDEKRRNEEGNDGSEESDAVSEQRDND